MNADDKAELIVLIAHVFVVVLVLVCTTVLAVANKIDAQTLAVIFSTALGFSGAKASAISVRRRNPSPGP